MMDDGIEWVPVPGFDGWYDYNRQGQFRTWRWRGARRNNPGLLKPRLTQHGYWCVYLIRPDGTQAVMSVARAVLTFHAGPCPEGMECCHNNGIRTDNRPENLRWDTRAGNFADKKLHGTENFGERNGTRRHPERVARGDRNGARLRKDRVLRGANHPSQIKPWTVCRGERVGTSKLTENDVREIRASVEPRAAIAAKYGVSLGTVMEIRSRRTWAHVA